ncbi:MAG: hypothetical protein NTY98_00345 [Verrucomicrobia bacterium]|nr:hypothetical protein [Verrucomicrobiota bacterium]
MIPPPQQQMRRYLLWLLVIPFILLAAAWFWCWVRPMAFMRREYPMWRAKFDLAKTLAPGSVVILGDSQAVAGMIPEKLGDAVVNLALGGGTPIEAAALSRIVLEPGHTPRAVILSFSPLRFMENAYLNQGVNYGLFDLATVDGVRARSRKFHSIEFGPETACDLDARLKVVLYCARFPSFYYSSLRDGRLWTREADNLDIYHRMIKSHGYFTFGNRPGSRELSRDSQLKTFSPSPLIDSYFAEIITLFAERGIPVFFISCPLTEQSIAVMPAAFKAEREAYLRQYEARYPSFHVLGDAMPGRPWTDFGDPDHFNIEGAQRFSDEIAKLLQAAGVSLTSER